MHIITDKMNFPLKAIRTYFKDIENLDNESIVRAFFRWTINSKRRRLKSLKRYLRDELDKFIHSDKSEYIEMREEADKIFASSDDLGDYIIRCLRFVHGKIEYVRDIKLFGMLERWEPMDEVWRNKAGDCESQNTLVYCMACYFGTNSIIDNLYAVLGDTINDTDDNIDHFYLVYFDPKTEALYPIDSTYYYSGYSFRYRGKFRKQKYGKLHYAFTHNETHKIK